MKKLNIAVIMVFISPVITVFLLFLNDIVISIRLNELKANLLEQDHIEGGLDHIGLVATYQIHKNIYEKRVSQENADAIEGKIISILKSQKINSPAVIPTKYNIISQPALRLINFNRLIVGKAPLEYHTSQDTDLADLDVAYYYERNFLFTRAIELYEKALKNKNINNALKASIMLHQGYCYALAGLNDKALNNYSAIINNYSQESSAITATILSRYLEGFKLARERVLVSNADPLLRSQDLVDLLAYEQALGILQDAELRAKPEDIPRIKYFIARCYAGLGKPEKAVENYLQVIADSPSSRYAMYSNRKLFMIGSRAGGDNNIINISKQLNNKLKDPVLSRMIENQKDNPGPDDYVKNFEEINVPKMLIERVDKIKVDAEKSPSTGGYLVIMTSDGNTFTASVGSYLVIMTSDGNTFKGYLIQHNEKEIALQTSIGRINVKRYKIIMIYPEQ